MFEYPCPLLKAFFAIPQSVVDQDLKGALNGVEQIREELARLMWRVNSNGIDDAVRTNHLLILQAYAMSWRPGVPLEVKVLYAQRSAGLLASESEDSVCSSPRGKELIRQIDVIEQREGLTGEANEQGPPEYHRLNDELGALIDGAYQNVFLLALRRYGMDELASLYESGPAEFSLLATIGSRALSREPLNASRATIEKEDQSIQRQHGPAALRRVIQRVAELRPQVSHLVGPWPARPGES